MSGVMEGRMGGRDDEYPGARFGAPDGRPEGGRGCADPRSASYRSCLERAWTCCPGSLLRASLMSALTARSCALKPLLVTVAHYTTGEPDLRSGGAERDAGYRDTEAPTCQ